MNIINQSVYFYMIFQVILYVIQTVFFLFKPFNAVQRVFNNVLLQSHFTWHLKITFSILSSVLAFLFFESYYKWKYDADVISHMIIQDAGHALHEKEDMYRSERNMYITGIAFFASMANVRYLLHQQDYYETQKQLEIEKKAQKK